MGTRKLPTRVLAFVDEIEDSPNGRLIRFDCVPRDATNALAKQAQGRPLSLQALRELRPFFLVVVASRATIRRKITGPRDPREGQWYELKIGTGVAATAFDGLLGLTSDVRVAHGRLIDGRTREAQALAATFSLDDIPDSDGQTLAAVLSAANGDAVVAYDVGQGSANALCAPGGMPTIYFDFGGGCIQNEHTFPAHRTFCIDQQPIVLSHWDTDHWSSGERYPTAQETTWVAPRQRLGPSHALFARNVDSRGTLLIWPAALPRLVVPWGHVERCTGRASSRNGSGLAVMVTVRRGASSETALLPGDASFACVPSSSQPLHGLAATHHGGRWYGGTVPSPSSPARLACSFGVGNLSHHPFPATMARYQAAGWAAPLDTPNGNAVIAGRRATTQPCGGCAGRHCTLDHHQ